MKAILLIVAFCFVASAVGKQQTLCDKYASALGLTGAQLVGAVVTGTVGGVVAVGTPTKKFFDGTSPPGSINFLANTTAFGILFTHLVEFFGAPSALDCTDGSVPAYEGNPNMQQVHAAMPIDNTAFVFFNTVLLNVTASAGVTAADNQAISDLLESFRGSICNQPGCDSTTTTGSASSSSGVAIIAPVVGFVAAIMASFF